MLRVRATGKSLYFIIKSFVDRTDGNCFLLPSIEIRDRSSINLPSEELSSFKYHILHLREVKVHFIGELIVNS